MPREPRIYIEKVLYFITARGLQDRHLFSDAEDFNAYLRSLREYQGEYGFKLFAFALLPKHLCLLIELRNNVTISTIMHNLNSHYTKSYNSRYGNKGHLFQSRFKSILVEKENNLLRLTRYIHMMPKNSGITDNLTEYPYSSYSAYVSFNTNQQIDSEIPEMASEIQEALNHLSGFGTGVNKQKAYEAYVQSADDEEMKNVEKLLHRTAFVGSKDFCKEIKNRIKEHIIEEERAKVVRKTNPAFAISGGLIIIFMGVVAYNFYNNQSALQNALNVTASGFEVAREDLARRVNSLKSEISGFEEKQNYGLGGLAWEIQMMPVQQESSEESYTDLLEFKDGKVISAVLKNQGFTPFEYTITRETHGHMTWKTVQTNAEGLTVRWYGIVTGDKMRGVLSERPVQGKNRDFSFMSVRRVSNG